jgi:hypothetical protein
MLRSLLRRALFGVTQVSSLPSRRRERRESSLLNSETLESRLLLSAANSDQNLEQQVVDQTDDPIVSPLYLDASSVSPDSTSGPFGYTPAQIRNAYGFNSITFANGTVAGDGTGTTIAIVDAYDDPNIASDLHQFDAQFGLPDPTFSKVNQSGGTSLPKADSGWSGEIALDVEWAHAMAPKAKILLVEATDASLSNLMSAVNYARSASGVDTVSMSWGSNEFKTEKSYDSYFTTPTGHNGVTFFSSSGDSGAPVGFPAISPNVVGVGGTSLNISNSGTYSGESGWSGSGGGVSSYETQPLYQKGVVTQSSAARTSPDVSFDADPNTGFAVYNSYSNTAARPWEEVGGTSAASPQSAALVAIADQGRALSGLGSLDGATQTLPKIYALASSDFHDVTSGSSTGSPTYTAGAGYDLVTGRGTPVANLVVRDLVGTSSTTPPPTTPTAPVATHFAVTSIVSTTAAGTSFSITVTALDSSNAVVTGYAGAVHLTSTDLSGILPATYTFTTSDKGVHTFTGVVLKTAGTQSLSASDVANSSLLGSVSVKVIPAAATHLAFLQQPTSVGAGLLISPTVQVEVLDAYNNVVTTDNQHTVTIAIGANPAAGVLGGTLTATVSGGIATFSTLSINQLGNGYTLVASSAGLSSVTSGSFNVASPTRVIESFESGSLYNYSQYGGGYFASAGITPYASHDGFYGLMDSSGSDWIYRDDAASQVRQGDTISVWMAFVGGASGVAAFGFGASGGGTLSLVASPMSHQLMLMNDVGYGATTLGAVNATFQSNHWYRMEVTWGTTGNITGKLYDSNGTTLLQTVTGSTNVIKSGGIAFKANGGNAVWDTVLVTSGASTAQASSVINLSQTAVSGSSGQSGGATNAAGSCSTTPAGGTSSVTTPGGITPTSLDDAFLDFGGLSSQIDSIDTPQANNRQSRVAKHRLTEPLKIERLSRR